MTPLPPGPAATPVPTRRDRRLAARRARIRRVLVVLAVVVLVGTVAGAVVDLLTGESSGEAMVIQAGREPLPFRFARPPGPRAGGTVGQMPPEEFAAHDQGR